MVHHVHRLILTDILQDASLYGAHNFSWSASHCLRSDGYHLQTQVQSIPVIDTDSEYEHVDTQTLPKYTLGGAGFDEA